MDLTERQIKQYQKDYVLSHAHCLFWGGLSASEKDKIRPVVVRLYNEEYVTIVDIIKETGISKSAIYRVLREAGIDTSKGRRYKATCKWCEREFGKTRSQMRRRKYHFCSSECYLDYLRELGKDYIYNRQGMRIARSIVGDHFSLEPGMVVHHINKITLDNRLSNLMVFRTNSEHVKHHRQVENITPIWVGH